ncbi:MAG: DUF134 domain-containing protein [Fretibacterium sp.]|nr:DUF134 domain-containing protein [Fretibacterium sp.]
MPVRTEFAPVGKPFQPSDAVIMTVDEYEAIRLIDHEGFNQEKCAGYMNIARTTAQQIYNTARKKLSVSLVEGRPLVISGGEYRLCGGDEPCCGCGGCHCRRRGRMETTEEENQ